jgi:hypothetical protein
MLDSHMAGVLTGQSHKKVAFNLLTLINLFGADLVLQIYWLQ